MPELSLLINVMIIKAVSAIYSIKFFGTIDSIRALARELLYLRLYLVNKSIK